MEKELEKVKEFQNLFLQPVGSNPTLEVNHDIRYKLMAEENDEYKEAMENNNLVEVADALGDQLYILYGTILSHGMQHIIKDVFNEIHKSNMSKLGHDNTPVIREDGKIIKGPNYFKPDLDKFLK